MAYLRIQNNETKEVKVVHAVDAREWVKNDVEIIKLKDGNVQRKPKWSILGKGTSPNDPKLSMQPGSQVLEERVAALEKLNDSNNGNPEISKPLDKMTVAELKDKAEEAGVEGFADMKKPELVAALSTSGN